MGYSLDAALYYGYDLGGEEDGWTFATYNGDKMTYNWPAWMETDEDGDVEDPVTQIGNRLTELLGDGHGIETDMCGTGDWSDWVVGFEILGGTCMQSVDPNLLADIDFESMDIRLRTAMRELGLEFEDQDAPKLFLVVSCL